MYKVMHNLNWLDPTAPLQINNPNFHHLLYHGFGNARSLAKMFHTVNYTVFYSNALLQYSQILFDNLKFSYFEGLPAMFDNHFRWPKFYKLSFKSLHLNLLHLFD